MTLTRRDLLTGTTVVLAGGVSIAVTPVDPANPDGIALNNVPHPAPIPTDAELRHWETHYKARYKATHRARNQAILQMATQDPVPKRADLVLEDLEAEERASRDLVDEDTVEAVAWARARGFDARRAGQLATDNPNQLDTRIALYNDDRFMAWYAGWVQAGDQSHVLDGSRGYTPPQPYFCSLCGVAEGKQHNGGCADQNPVHPDGLIVRRPRPWRHGGHTFT